MASVAANMPVAAAGPNEDVLHLLFNDSDGILTNDELPLTEGVQPLSPSGLLELPDELFVEGLASPDHATGSSISNDSTESLPAFDLDSFLSGAECLDHSTYDIDLTGCGNGLQYNSGASSTGPGGGGPIRGGQRRKRQLLPYSLQDVDTELEVSEFDAVDDDSQWDLSGQLRGQPGEPLSLSREERRLAVQLGFHLPTHFPLTRDEERCIRTIRRKIRNKISAKNSRAKRQEYVRGLEIRAKDSTTENAKLKEKCCSLEQQNRKLMAAIRRLHTVLQAAGIGGVGGKATGTGLLLLCLSFALFLSPQLSLFQQMQMQQQKQHSDGGGAEVSGRVLPMPASSRRILELSDPPPNQSQSTDAINQLKRGVMVTQNDNDNNNNNNTNNNDNNNNNNTNNTENATDATMVSSLMKQQSLAGELPDSAELLIGNAVAGFHDDSDDAYFAERELHDREL